MTAAATFQLTEELIEQFYREGYFYAPGFLDPNAVEALNKEIEKFANGPGDGQWRSRGISLDNDRDEYPDTIAMLNDPRIVSMMERILGDNVRLWLGMFAVVAPNANGLEWHQDNQYTHVLGHMLNGFIALDPIDERNAGLWLAPGSHLLGRQPNLNGPDHAHRRAAEPANAMPCRPMSPGDAVFFHRETLHHSKRNHTDRPRRAFAFQAAAANCRYAKTGKLIDDRPMLSVPRA
ncbi:phytanoyl-CoA dioxygenase family protein [Paenibacillus lycopersici]|uniref:Phytanoyl-CoA dioxygenase family protein n=1 Tax=Paenibacillus lycopersici TaxID=2704462 RepID=A0A6C0FVK3_9BACL|nr:phytanoyl-CoA dioxygenase family protein [Paenibacillus lycopersici]QHT61178.1 phytanoyl-CoA dioxygenase family protein [Paenibacillus lycopersici]